MKRLALLTLLAILLAFPSTARADIAPPAQPPGSNLEPGTGTTQVRMLAETVQLDVQPGASGKSLGQARVTADFMMHNTGQTAETMAARFPVGATDGWSSVNELRDLRVQVSGKGVSTRRIMGEDPYNSNAPVPWAEFDVTFPPDQDVPVRVQYTLEASGEYPFIWFKYVLSSGARWKDTIGSADLIVQLPYTASPENVLIGTSQVSFGTSAGGVLAGKAIRWHYENLEPTASDNFEVHLVMPSAWERLLTEQSNVAQKPRDGEAWGRLGKLAKEMAFSSRRKGFRGETSSLDPGGASLYHKSIDAYDKAVALLPNDALWHAGYADLLGYHAYFESFNSTDTTDEAVRGLREIQIALSIAPADPQVQDIAYLMTYYFPAGVQRAGDAYDFPWLTATPPRPAPSAAPPTEVAENLSASPTTAPLPTDTPQVVPTQVPTVAPTAQASNPLCGSALVLPLLLAGLVITSRHKFQRS